MDRPRGREGSGAGYRQEVSYDGFEVELEGVFVDAEPVPTASNRWVLAWAAGVVAVLALLAWWAGQGSEPDQSAEPAPESDPGPAPVDPGPGPDPSPDPAPASDASVTGAAGPVTGGGPGAAAAGPMWTEVGEGSGYDLLGIDRQGNAAVLDFDTGSISRFGLSSVGRGFGTAGAVLPVGERLAAVHEGRLILAGRSSEPEVLTDQAFGWRGTTGDPPVFWGYASEGRLFAVPTDGAAPIELPGEVRPVAVWDRLMLVQAVDDIILVPIDDPGSASLFAHGRVVSASSGAVAYQTCEVLDCRFLVGRPGEPEWTEVPEWTEAPWSEMSPPYGAAASLSALSPDGSMMIRPRWWETGTGLLVHHLASGALRPVADTAGVLPFDAFLRRAVWSPDNRLAVIETGPAAGPGEFRVVRTVDGTSARLPDDLVQVIELVPDPPGAG